MYKNSWLFLLAVLLILITVFVPTISFDRMLGKDVEKFVIKINEISTLEEKNNVEEKCCELENIWSEHMDHWSFVVHHSAIEKIDLSIVAFIEYSRKGEKESADIEAERLIKLLENTLSLYTVIAIHREHVSTPWAYSRLDEIYSDFDEE